MALLAALIVPVGIWAVGVERRLAKGRIQRHMETLALEHVRGLRRLRHGLWPRDEQVESLDVIDGGHVQIDYYTAGLDAERIGSVFTQQRIDAPRHPGGASKTLRVEMIGGQDFYTWTWREHGRRSGRARRDPDALLVASVLFEREPALTAEGYERAVLTLGLVGLGAMLLGGALAWLVSNSMVRPVLATAEAAESISTPTERLPERVSRDELGRLIAVLNTMLGRLQEGADRERDFLTTASHELRRPLAALIVELELSQRGARSTDDLAQTIALALGDAHSMGRLVDDLLLHARSRAGGMTVDEQPVDLVELVTESIGRCVRVVADDVSIEVGTLPDVIVAADAACLSRAIENVVVSSACRAGAEGRVEVMAARRGDDLSIEVIDSGPAVSGDSQARLFESFSRLDKASCEGCHGLGLSIAKKLTEVHGGKIEVESPIADGRGTRFSIVLPGERVTAR